MTLKVGDVVYTFNRRKDWGIIHDIRERPTGNLYRLRNPGRPLYGWYRQRNLTLFPALLQLAWEAE